MANKKEKTEQEAKALETPEPESKGSPDAGAEDGKGTEPEPGAEDGEDTGQKSETETGEGADQDNKPLPKVLTALRPILYLARQYKAGDPLPVNNTEMVEAWIAAGSAEWREKKGGRFFP